MVTSIICQHGVLIAVLPEGARLPPTETWQYTTSVRRSVWSLDNMRVNHHTSTLQDVSSEDQSAVSIAHTAARSR